MFPENPQLAAEREIILQETRSIWNKTLELGEGDWALGAVRAFAAGVTMSPLPPAPLTWAEQCPPGITTGRYASCSGAICLSPRRFKISTVPSWQKGVRRSGGPQFPDGD